MHLVVLWFTAVGWDDMGCRNFLRQFVDDRIVKCYRASEFCADDFASKQRNRIGAQMQVFQ